MRRTTKLKRIQTEILQCCKDNVTVCVSKPVKLFMCWTDTHPPRNAPTGFFGGGKLPKFGDAATSSRTTRVVESHRCDTRAERGRMLAAERTRAEDIVVEDGVVRALRARDRGQRRHNADSRERQFRVDLQPHSCSLLIYQPWRSNATQRESACFVIARYPCRTV